MSRLTQKPDAPGASPSPAAVPPNGDERTPDRPPDRPKTAGRARAVLARLLGLPLLIGAVTLGYVMRDRVGPVASTTSASAGDATAAATAEPTIWTCSMHPQIQQPNAGLCPICGMDLIPLESGGGEEEGLRELSISRAARELMDIQTAPVEHRFVTATIRMVGKVTYDETRLGYITAWVPGRLDRLYVDYTGVQVQKGDHMVSIYSPDLYSAQGELIQAAKSARERRSPVATASAERLLESAREKLRLWGLTDAQVREIERQDEPSDHLTIHAPMSGIVIHKDAQEGMYVDTGTRIYTIADLAQIWVKLDAYESDLTWLRYGQTVEFTTEAYPGEVFRGRVAFIDPVLDPRTRTVKVRVNVPNPTGRLKPDMFVRGEVHARVATAGRVMDAGMAGRWICRMHPGVVKDQAGDCDVCGMPLVKTETLGYVSSSDAADDSAEPLVVPASAVLMTGARAVVYVERPDADRPTYEGREVVLGPRAGDFYLVRGGLEEGERVVTNGNFKLDSALQIAARPSMMNPGVGLDLGEAGGSPGQGGDDRLQLPPTVALQLRRVREAADRAAEARRAGDKEALRQSLRRFEDALARVDAGALQGQALRAWKELAMRLHNDAVEGRWAASPERADRAVDGLVADVGRIASRFDLPDRAAGGAADIPPGFRERLAPLWAAYTRARDALVADDPHAARKAATEAAQVLGSIDAGPLTGVAQTTWTAARRDLEPAINRMTKDGDLAALRSQFAEWTGALEPIVSTIGVDPSIGTVYRQSCSMALDNKGASWLQAGETALNPYMGQRMPNCTTGVEVAWDGPPDGPAARTPELEAPEPFRRALAGLWPPYLKVQDALASDDAEAARLAAADLKAALAAVEQSAGDHPIPGAWEALRSELRGAIDAMARAENLAAIRSRFARLSTAMLDLVRDYRPEVGGAVYRLHCPMAFDGRGAGWLQKDDQVRNPYFGAAMIRCATEVERVAAGGSRGEVSDHE